MGIAWEQLSVGVAAIVGLVLVARTLVRVQRYTLDFLGNHLSALTKVVHELQLASERHTDAVERLSSIVRDMQRAPRPRGKSA
jgi:Tfp pilus assembly protein PilN